MKHFSVLEHGTIPRQKLPEHVLRRLQRFDERLSRVEGAGVFDWSRLQHIKATNYVGVVQVPGVTVEILPKIDDAPGTAVSRNEGLRQRAQCNLLYMLSLTKNLPLEERDLADQKLRRLPLLEMMIRIFLKRLLTELRRGRDQSYLYRQENLPILKGKLLTTQHLRLNLARHDRFYVGYDEFVADTLLNRILKSACRRLLGVSTNAANQQLAREAILDLADVDDVKIERGDFERVQLTRSSERFRVLVSFSELVLTDRSPEPSVGGRSTFSLLFPMEKLFEEFVGEFIRRHATALGTHRSNVHVQAVRRHRWLLKTTHGTGRFRMRPDVLIERRKGQTRFILDTKWKRLKRDAEDPKNGVAQADMYQLFAYAHRYLSADNVLLFPRVPGVTPKQYRLQDDELQRTIRVEFIDLNRDLAKATNDLVRELRGMLNSAEDAR